ncbi:MAG: hydrogenase maturation protease [Bacteroides sp.]|nr:hydrogenase maturation protease [Bacteroides sp.]
MTPTDLNDRDVMQQRVLIMGIGNLVLQDEGFGIHVIRELQNTQLPPYVDLLDGGTAGLHLMGYLQQYERVVVVDAALDSYPEGTLRCLKPSFGEFPPLVTAHEIGLKDVLEALTVTGFCPEVTLIVCSVKKYTSLGVDLSPAVRASVLPAARMALKVADCGS